MSRRRVFLPVLALGIAATVGDTVANGLRLADQDAFATARGEAFVATADNASAIYYNPAGISQLDGQNVRGGIYGIYLDPTFRPPNGSPNSGHTYHIQHNYAAVPQLFYVCAPGGSPLSFGVGVYAPFGGSITWPQDTGFRAVATQGELTYLTLNPVVALKLAPNLSIAGGLMVSRGDIDLEQGLRPFAQPLVNYFRFKGDGWGIGYNLGLLWQPCQVISLGATFRSETSITMSGDTEFEQQPLIPSTRIPADAEFTFPMTAVFGVSYRPTSKWNMEFDADYTDWSSFGEVTIHQGARPPFPVQQNVSVTLNWQPSWMYEFGVTRYFGDGWHASAGYVFNQSSVPDAFYSPVAADLDRHFFSIGAGRRGGRLDFDIAYQLGYGPPRTVRGSTPSSTPGLFAGQTADGTYEFISHAVIVSAGLHF